MVKILAYIFRIIDEAKAYNIIYKMNKHYEWLKEMEKANDKANDKAKETK